MTVSCQACGRAFSVEARSSDAPSFVARCPGCGQPVIVRPALGAAYEENLPAPKGWVAAPVVAEAPVDLLTPKRAPEGDIIDLPAPKREPTPVGPSARKRDETVTFVTQPPHDPAAAPPGMPSEMEDLPAPKREAGGVDLPAPKREAGGVDLPAPKREAGGVDLPAPKREAGGVDLPAPKREAGDVDLPQAKREAGAVDLPQAKVPLAPRVLTPPPPSGPPPVSLTDLGGEVPGLDEIDGDLGGDRRRLGAASPRHGGPPPLTPPPFSLAAAGEPAGDEVIDLPAPRGFMPGNTGPLPRIDDDVPDLPAPKGARPTRRATPFLPTPLPPASDEALPPPAMQPGEALQLDASDLQRVREAGGLPTPVDALSTAVTAGETGAPLSVLREQPHRRAPRPKARIGRMLLVAGGLGVAGLTAALVLMPDLRDAIGLGGSAARKRAERIVTVRRLIADDTPTSYRKAAAEAHELAEQDPRARSARALEAQARLSVALLGAASETKAADRALAPIAGDPPETSELALARALRQLVDGKAQEAESALVAALQQSPTDPGLLVALGWTHASAGDPAAATLDFNKALGVEPARAQALYGLGRAKEISGTEGTGALEIYKKTLAASPQHLGAALGVERLSAAAPAESEKRLQTLLDQSAASAAPRELAELWSLLARRSAEGGRLDEAESRYRKALGIQPALVEAKIGLARTLCAMRRHAEALPLGDAASKAEPRSGPALLVLAQAQVESGAPPADVAITLALLEKVLPGAASSFWNGRLEELRGGSGSTDRAIARYRESIKADPRFVDAYLALARVLGRSGDAAGSTAALQQAEGQASGAPALRDRLGEAFLAVGDTVRAEAIFVEVITAAPELLSARLHLGDTLERTGRLTEAAAVYAEMAARSKDAPGLAERRGRLALALHRTDEALGFLQAALSTEKNPSPGLRTAAGEALFTAGKIAEARTLFEQAVKDDDRHGAAHLGLSRTALAQGQNEEAQLEARRAVNLTGSAAAHLALGRAEEALGRLDLARSEFAMAARPPSPPAVSLEARIGGVRILVRSGAVKDALAAAAVLVKEAPGRSEPVVLIGDCHDELGQRDKALKAYEAAVKLGPRDAEARFKLGRALFDAGKAPLAARQLDEALQLGGDGAAFAVEGYLIAGDAHKQAGERAAAAASYRKYMELAKPDASGRRAVGQWLEAAGAP